LPNRIISSTFFPHKSPPALFQASVFSIMAMEGDVCIGSGAAEGIMNIESTPTGGTALAEYLLTKCQTLLNELEAFSTFVTEQKLEQDPAAETRKFQNSVATELKSLQKVQEPSAAFSSPSIR